jgi:predicted nucleic acid-binding protein
LKSSVLDSYAILVFLFRQKGHEKVLELLERSAGTEKPLLIAAPNWAEVRYMVERKAGAGRWPEVRAKLRALPIAIVAADEALAEQAGALKANHRMSLADCFAAALAQQRKADLYTGDPEFRAVEKEIRVVWI